MGHTGVRYGPSGQRLSAAVSSPNDVLLVDRGRVQRTLPSGWEAVGRPNGHCPLSDNGQWAGGGGGLHVSAKASQNRGKPARCAALRFGYAAVSQPLN